MQNNTIELSDLTGKLQSEDQRYSNIAKRMKIMYYIMIPVYIIYIIRLFQTGSSMTELLGGLCFLLAMIVFAYIFNKFHKDYKDIDYSLPTLLMLKEAAKRYTPFRQNTIWVLLGVVFFDVGLVLGVPESENVWYIQAIFLGAIVTAIFVGLLIWRKRYKPLRDDALKLIEQLMN